MIVFHMPTEVQLPPSCSFYRPRLIQLQEDPPGNPEAGTGKTVFELFCRKLANVSSLADTFRINACADAVCAMSVHLAVFSSKLRLGRPLKTSRRASDVFTAWTQPVIRCKFDESCVLKEASNSSCDRSRALTPLCTVGHWKYSKQKEILRQGKVYRLKA